jgi:hypothetical protein
MLWVRGFISTWLLDESVSMAVMVAMAMVVVIT